MYGKLGWTVTDLVSIDIKIDRKVSKKKNNAIQLEKIYTIF
jgi:hypothetical protein